MFGLATTNRMMLQDRYWFHIKDDTIYLDGDLRYKVLFKAVTCNEKAWYLLNSIESPKTLYNLIIRKTLCDVQVTGHGTNHVFRTDLTLKDCWELILNPDIVFIHDPIKTCLQILNIKKMSITQYLNTRLLCGNIEMVM